MATFESTTDQLSRLLEADNVTEAERVVDRLAELDSGQLDRMWGMQAGGGRHYVSIFYNNVGINCQRIGIQAHQRGDREGGANAAHWAERCHQKALDIYDMSAEDFVFMPSDLPFSKNLICTFWGLGTAKFVLGRREESRKYLTLCLRIRAEDEQAAHWQSDASNYLRLLDAKPVRIVVKARSVMPNMFDPHLLQVEGDLLEWGSYARPMAEQFAVRVTDDDIDFMEGYGIQNPLALEDRTLVLRSDESGDLRRALRIIEIL